MAKAGKNVDVAIVAPHAGAWIEISPSKSIEAPSRSPLTQGRGLKYNRNCGTGKLYIVAPHAGAWIEIYQRKYRSP